MLRRRAKVGRRDKRSVFRPEGNSVPLSQTALMLATAAETSGPSPYIVGAIALAILVTLLLVTVAYRSVGQRHRFRYRDGHGAPVHPPTRGSHEAHTDVLGDHNPHTLGRPH